MIQLWRTMAKKIKNFKNYTPPPRKPLLSKQIPREQKDLFPILWKSPELENDLKKRDVNPQAISSLQTASVGAIAIAEHTSKLQPAIQSPAAELQVINIGNNFISKNIRLIDELKAVAKFKGFQINIDPKISGFEMWLGNSHTVLADGKIYYPWLLDHRISISDCNKISNAAKCLDGYLSSFDPISSVFNAVLSLKRDEVVKRETVGKYKIGECVLEAGNVRPAIKKNGEHGVIIGSTSLYASLLLLDKQKKFTAEMVSNEISRLKSSNQNFDLQIEDVEKRLSNSFNLFETLKGYLTKRNNDLFEIFDIRDILKRYYPAEASNELSKKKAEEFLAKLELTKKAIAEDLEVKVEQITFVDQPYTFHLDMIMREHPKQGLLVQDDALSLKLLNYLKTIPKVTEMYKQDLNEYIEGAEERIKNDGARLEQMYQQLESAGYQVIRVPGFFARKPSVESRFNLGSSSGKGVILDESPFEIDLLNGISFRDKDGKSCLITFGGNAIPVNNAAAYFMTSNKIFDEIYLLGQSDTNGHGHYQTSHSLGQQGGGLKCMTYETRKLET